MSWTANANKARVAAPGRVLAVPAIMAPLGAAVVLRAVVAGRAGAASLPAAAMSSGLLVAIALASGWRPGRIRFRAIMAGTCVGALLVAGPVALNRTDFASHAGAGTSRMVVWTLVVSSVALAEEALLRGALWDALARDHGVDVALVATTVAFAIMHIPLYGWRASPLDLGVGLALGALRLWTGGVEAPAVAHLLADLAGGWL